MNIHDRATDITDQVTGTTQDIIKQAYKVWDDRSKDEQQGILAVIGVALLAGLLSLVWSAARNGTASGRYIDLPKRQPKIED